LRHHHCRKQFGWRPKAPRRSHWPPCPRFGARARSEFNSAQCETRHFAGAPLPLALEREIFAQRRLKIHNFYGSTECGGIAYDESQSPRSDESCVGCPMVNVTLTVEDRGCLVVHGDNVGETYWPEPAPELGGGRFQTSDLVELRRDKCFCVVARATRSMWRAGKFRPRRLSGRCSASANLECLVFGVPSRDADGRRKSSRLSFVNAT